MKLAVLLVPAYLPPSHPGATPTPYQSGLVDKFEMGLAKLSPVVIRGHNVTRLIPDEGGRWLTQQIVTPYRLIVSPAETALGDAIALTLKSFNIPKVTVLFVDADGEDFALGDADALANGLHPWNEEA